MAYAPAFPHDPVEEIATDVFMVRGSLRMNPLIGISRNMAIVRHEGELSLINPIRLDEAGLAQLQSLGAIKRIIRLGSLHGLDDQWYVDKFGTEFWGRSGSQKYTPPPIDTELREGQPMPFPLAELFCFNCVPPESAILLTRGRGLLLTCDAIQHYGDYCHMSPLTRLILPFIGFPKKTIVGPIWLKAITAEHGSLRADFERLRTLEFDSLLSAHGSFLATGAHAAVANAADEAFRSRGSASFSSGLRAKPSRRRGPSWRNPR